MRHIISILANKRPGILCRIASVFSGNALNIDSLSMGESAVPSIFYFTVSFQSNADIASQVIGKIGQLIDVIDVKELRCPQSTATELLLLIVRENLKAQLEIKGICLHFKAGFSEMEADTLLIEISGSEQVLSEFLEAMKPFRIVEFVRSGITALPS